MTKPNLKTATFKEIADWVYEAPDHKRVAEGLTFTSEKPTEENRKVDIEVGGFTFWYPSWGQGDKSGITLYGNPEVYRLPSVTKAMEKIAEVFGIAMEDAKELVLPTDSVEPMSETERENLQLQAKLEVYQSLLPVAIADTVNSKYEFILGLIKTGRLRAKNYSKGNKPFWLVPESEVARYHDTAYGDGYGYGNGDGKGYGDGGIL